MLLKEPQRDMLKRLHSEKSRSVLRSTVVPAFSVPLIPMTRAGRYRLRQNSRCHCTSDSSPPCLPIINTVRRRHFHDVAIFNFRKLHNSTTCSSLSPVISAVSAPSLMFFTVTSMSDHTIFAFTSPLGDVGGTGLTLSRINDLLTACELSRKLTVSSNTTMHILACSRQNLGLAS